MTGKEAKIWLERVRDAEALANAEMEERDRLRSLAGRVTSSTGREGGTRRSADQREQIIVRLMDAENQVYAETAELLTIKRDVMRALRKLKRCNHRNVLFQHYILGKTWPQVADSMHYSISGLACLHGRALEELGKVLESEGKEP